MGCDIHVFTESLETVNNQTKWINCDHWKINKYAYEDGEPEYTCVEIYRGRNYELFSVLANVRNGSGNEFMAEPKGLPEDASPQVVAASDRWGCDGHSHSYWTLAELKAFQAKSGMVKRSGMVDPESAAALDATGKDPDTWCAWTNIPGHVYREWTVSGSPLTPIIEALEERMRENVWIREGEQRPDLEEKIRIVFWFDN